MKIAIYARVSLSKGIDQRQQDAENQLVVLRSATVSAGWEVYREYVDKMSGGSDKRPEYKKMLYEAEKGKFGLVYFWALDRLSREGAFETLSILRKLDGWGVGWKSYSEPYLDSMGIFKDAILSILATIAKQERIRMSERVKAGIARKMEEQGHWGRLTKVVDRDALYKRHQEGYSLRALAKEFGISSTSVKRYLWLYSTSTKDGSTMEMAKGGQFSEQS